MYSVLVLRSKRKSFKPNSYFALAFAHDMHMGEGRFAVDAQNWNLLEALRAESARGHWRGITQRGTSLW